MPAAYCRDDEEGIELTLGLQNSTKNKELKWKEHYHITKLAEKILWE